MVSRFIILLVLVAFSTRSKAEISSSDIMIVDVYNQYVSAIYAAELCDEIPFENDEEKTKFENNFKQVINQAEGAFKRRSPEFTEQQITEAVDRMDSLAKNMLKKFYDQEGCSNEVLTDALKWHNNFAKMKPFPAE